MSKINSIFLPSLVIYSKPENYLCSSFLILHNHLVTQHCRLCFLNLSQIYFPLTMLIPDTHCFLPVWWLTVSYYCPVSSFILFSYIPYTAVEVIFLKPKLDHVTYWSHWITPKEYKTKTKTLWHAYKAPNDLNLFLYHTAQPSSLWFRFTHKHTLLPLPEWESLLILETQVKGYYFLTPSSSPHMTDNSYHNYLTQTSISIAMIVHEIYFLTYDFPN